MTKLPFAFFYFEKLALATYGINIFFLQLTTVRFSGGLAELYQ